MIRYQDSNLIYEGNSIRGKNIRSWLQAPRTSESFQ